MMNVNANHRLGLAQVFISGMAFGFLGVFGKRAYDIGMTPGELLSLRFLLSTVILGILLLWRPHLYVLPRKKIVLCLLLGTVCALFTFCYFTALQTLSASLTVLLLYTYPVLVTLGEHFLFKVPLSRMAVIALPISLSGLMLLVAGDWRIENAVGLAWGMGASIAYSGYILLSGRTLKHVSPLISSFYVLVGTALSLSLLHLHSVDRVAALLRDGWWIITGLAVICTVIPMTLFFSGIQKIKLSEAAILSMTEPATAVLAATLLLGEHLRGVQLLGGSLVLLAMFLTVNGHAVRIRWPLPRRAPTNK